MRLTAAVAAAASLLSFSAASTLTPPILPLVVRNPYLSTWLANAREEPWSRWPMFYTGESVGSCPTYYYIDAGAERSSRLASLSWLRCPRLPKSTLCWDEHTTR